jgi:hydroxymethylglutaryl-CoA reductase
VDPKPDKKSNIKFYDLTLEQRWKKVAEQCTLDPADIDQLNGAEGLSTRQADHMIENVIGVYGLPLAVAQNFMVNGRDVLVPMAIEEPSVVAGASFMARIARQNGGFFASTSAPEMIGQMQVLNLPDVHSARLMLLEQKARLLAEADSVDPVLKKAGGGARDLEVKVVEDSPIGPFLIVHLIFDVRDAMGANAVNTAVETLAPMVEEITRGRVLLRILSNLADRRLARARVSICVEHLAFDTFSGEDVRDNILAACAFAEVDPFRAATHNKGIMNGIDAVVVATANDWRAVEAGAHAYAARSGQYKPLTHWGVDSQGSLVGSIELPLAVGIIGGATRVHPSARAALKLMGVQTARELAEIIASVGLTQNLAALRALATEGIQRGHMSLHARQVAVAAGAAENQVDRVASQLVKEKNVRLDRAQEILKSLNNI